MTMWFRVFLLSCTAFAAGRLAAQPSLTELFPSQAEVFVESEGLSRLELPSEVLANVQADLSDLRLFDAEGNEVPYLRDRGLPQENRSVYQRSYRPAVQKVMRSLEELGGRDNSNFLEHLNLKLADDVPLDGSWQLVVNSPIGEFVRRLDVKTNRPGDPERYYLLENESLFRLQQGRIERTVFDLPPLTSRSLFVDIEGQAEGDSFLSPSFELRQSHLFDERLAGEALLTVTERTDEDGKTVLVVERPRGLEVVALRLDTTSTTFTRAVTVTDRSAGMADRPVAQGVMLFRIPARVRVENLEVQLEQTRGNQLQISIDNGDSPPLANLTVTALTARPALLFSMPPQGLGQAAGMLRFGGGRAAIPHYDLAAIEGVLLTQGVRMETAFNEPSAVRLGTIAVNPAFTTTPLFNFVSRPGAVIDSRVYTHVRQIQLQPSTEGLSRLELSKEDAALTRPDFADVRLIDGDSAQWAYLLEPNARQEWWSLPPLSPGVTRDGETTYRIEPAATPALLDRLRIDTQAVSFFDRPYTLTAVLEDGREQSISVGRLARGANERKAFEIEFAPVRVTALRLVISDGNDRRLEDLTAAGRFLLPNLYTVAPAGNYQLLMGYPEDLPPVYELAQQSAAVLAARAALALPGELSANPSYSAASRLNTGSGPQKILFWLALLAAVGVLAVMTLKSVRNEDASG